MSLGKVSKFEGPFLVIEYDDIHVFKASENKCYLYKERPRHTVALHLHQKSIRMSDVRYI